MLLSPDRKCRLARWICRKTCKFLGLRHIVAVFPPRPASNAVSGLTSWKCTAVEAEVLMSELVARENQDLRLMANGQRFFQ